MPKFIFIPIITLSVILLSAFAVSAENLVEGKVREERLNRPDIMEVGQVSIYQVSDVALRELYK